MMDPSDGGRAAERSLMDELLRAGVPEIKLALGEVIDRENARPLPARYARLLPETLLMVTLRADAADALSTIAADLERELTDSCIRHGTLYDRVYRVRLQRSSDPDAPLYSVATHAGRDITGSEGDAQSQSGPEIDARKGSVIPEVDPDATRIGAGGGEASAAADWSPGHWVLVVEGEAGEEREAFTLGNPVVTIGRRTSDPDLKAAIAISDAPHVSRRQLALAWESRDGAPGFRVYNLGLNAVHLPRLELPGSRAGKGAVDLDAIDPRHIGWLPPGVPLRIGDTGPTLRIEELAPDPEEQRIDPDGPGIDPDATVFE